MGTLDIILLICFVPAIIHGIQKGFIEQVFSVLGLLLGIWIGFRFAHPAGEFIRDMFHLDDLDVRVMNIIGFGSVFLSVILVVSIVVQLLLKTVKFVSFGWLDKILGIACSLFFAVALMGILIFIFDTFNGKWQIVEPEILNGSIVYTKLRDFAVKILPEIKTNIVNV